MAINKYYDSDCNLGVLDGKTVAVIGFVPRATPTPKTWPRAASTSSLVCAKALPTGRKPLSSPPPTRTSRSWKSKRLPRPATLL